jgi:hypothetical protein
MAEQMAGRVRALGREASKPNNRGRVIVLAGLATVVLLGAVGAWWFSGGTSSPPPPSANSVVPSASQAPLIPVQQYKDHGIALNVPKDWARSGSGTFVDFVDPTKDSGRKVRINIDASSATANQFLVSAENQLKKPAVCPSPYKRAGLTDAQLAGKPAGQLEYTCGNAPTMRHGIGQVAIVSGTAYYFYLTVPDSQFAASKVIFEEMVRSFQFVAA